MLTRQEFATVQSHLSSVYFSASSVCAGLSLGSFLLRHPVTTWSKEAKNLVRILYEKLFTKKNELLFSIGHCFNCCTCCS